jgi:hypothetical protein
MKRTGWNRRDFLKAGIQVAGVAGVGSDVNLLAAAEPRSRRGYVIIVARHPPRNAGGCCKINASLRRQAGELWRQGHRSGGRRAAI